MENVDFEHRTLAVVQQVQRVGGKVQITPPKLGKPYLIAMPDGVFNALKTLHRAQGEPSSGLLFKNQSGGCLEPVMLWRDYKKNLKAAGLPDIRLGLAAPNVSNPIRVSEDAQSLCNGFVEGARC